MTSHMLAPSPTIYQMWRQLMGYKERQSHHAIKGSTEKRRARELSASAEVLASFRAGSVVTSRLEISWIRSANTLHQRRLASSYYREANAAARPFSIMLKHKRSTTPSRYRGKGARGVSNHRLLPSPSTQAQTITPTKTASSLLDFLISCHKGQEVEPWMMCKITPGEI